MGERVRLYALPHWDVGAGVNFVLLGVVGVPIRSARNAIMLFLLGMRTTLTMMSSHGL